MTNKPIFLNKSAKSEAVDIISEIIVYIENQHKNGMLRKEFYNDTLLFTSEILPYITNQDKWIDIGYRICKYIKETTENYGYSYRTDMFDWLGYQCFTVSAFCKEANILQSFSRSMNQLLCIAINNKLNQIENAPTYDMNYDMISGVSGVLYYLLDCDYTQEEELVLIKCVEYLLAFTQDNEFCGKPVIKFHILQPNQNPKFDQKDFKNGSINFGLAHGMLGPLIALSKAYAKGIIVEGLREGIEKIYHLYETYQAINRSYVPYWPGTITVEEYWEGTYKPEHLHTASSWCYGNVGIMRGLQKVACYMNWPEKEQIYVEAMKCFLAQNPKEFHLFSPSLCHGFSSVVAIQNCAYSAYGDPKLLTNLERNVGEVIRGYRKNNERKASLMEIRNGTIWLEGYLKDLSLLTGSTGIATTLLSLQGNIKTGKLLMID